MNVPTNNFLINIQLILIKYMKNILPIRYRNILYSYKRY